MFFSKLFNKNSDQLAKEAINDYKNSKDVFVVIEKLQTALKNGVKNYPLDEIYLYIGSAYYDLSLHEKSAEAYEKGLEYNPKNHSILSNLGITYEKNGDSEKAFKYYKASLELKPDNSFAHHNIGHYYYEIGNHFDAIANLNKAISLNPALAVAHAIKARSLAYLGLYKEAKIVSTVARVKGYDNIDGLELDIERIKNENPHFYWDAKKYYEFITSISLKKEIEEQLVLAYNDPYVFYNNNKSMFQDKTFTDFEINNALHWHVIIQELSSCNKLITVGNSNETEEILESIKEMLNKNGFSINDSLDELENEFMFSDKEETILAISSKLKISNSIELLNIWTSEYSLNLFPMATKEWEKLAYPFSEVENGFGKIHPIATIDVIENFSSQE